MLSQRLFGAGFALGERPHVVACAGEFASRDHARELLEQQPSLASAAEAELADQLLVPGTSACGAPNPRQQIAIAPGIRGVGHRCLRG
jgi:hypothetical protein